MKEEKDYIFIPRPGVEYKAELVRHFNDMRTSVYLWEIGTTRGDVFSICYDGKDMIRTQISQVDERKRTKPLFVCPDMMVDAVLGAIVDMAAKKNIKPVDQTLLEGKMIAQEAHLQDMREIAKHTLKMKEK